MVPGLLRTGDSWERDWWDESRKRTPRWVSVEKESCGPGERTPIMTWKGPDEEYKQVIIRLRMQRVQMRMIKEDGIRWGLGHGW